MPSLNGVPVLDLDIINGQPHFRGAKTWGRVRSSHLFEESTRAARYTCHNWGDRSEIRRRLERGIQGGSLFETLNSILGQSMAFMYMTRDIGGQQRAVTDLLYGVELTYRQKILAREAQHHDQCNHWFGEQCLFHAVAHLVETWIDIKKEKFDRAWIHKIDAEDYLKICRTSFGASQIEASNEMLGYVTDAIDLVCRLDRSVFPPLEFGSSGFTYSLAHCSICGEDIASCEHVEGRVYWGKQCTMVRVQDMEFNHFARVENPKDRRSFFVTTESPEGICYHAMTGLRLRCTGKVTAAAHGRLTALPDTTN